MIAAAFALGWLDAAPSAPPTPAPEAAPISPRTPAPEIPAAPLSRLATPDIPPHFFAHELERQGHSGFVAPEMAESTRPARVTSDSLFGLSSGATCSVRFASGHAGCTAEIRCGDRVLFASRDGQLACLRGLGAETIAWDPSVQLSFTFASDRVRVRELGGGDRALELGLIPSYRAV